jgi:hypothetical protein
MEFRARRRRKPGQAEGNVQVFPICERDIKSREVYINPPAKEDEDG